MAKRNEATRLLKSGMSLNQIAHKMGVSFQTIVRYMKLQVAEGALKVSEVFFGLEPTRRELLERLLLETTNAEDTPGKRYYATAAEHGITWDEANLHWSLREAKISRGDMYEHLADLEVELHAFVRRTLEAEFGADEAGKQDGGGKASRFPCERAASKFEKTTPTP